MDNFLVEVFGSLSVLISWGTLAAIVIWIGRRYSRHPRLSARQGFVGLFIYFAFFPVIIVMVILGQGGHTDNDTFGIFYIVIQDITYIAIIWYLYVKLGFGKPNNSFNKAEPKAQLGPSKALLFWAWLTHSLCIKNNIIAKFIGYSIGAIFAVLLLLLIGFTAWHVYDVVSVLASTKTEKAQIEGCHYKIIKKSSSSYSVSWGPVAITKSGVRIKGDFTWKNKSWCESGIGESVTVFINENDASKNRINTFFQFWFTPTIFLLGCIIFYPVSYMLKKRKRKNA